MDTDILNENSKAVIEEKGNNPESSKING